MAKLLIVVAAALVDADGRVLLAQRPKGKQMGGYWEFPGGKVDEGEAPESALCRELSEELGIEVSAACLAPFSFASEAQSDKHLMMPLYICRKWSGSPRAIEAEALAWARPGDLLKYELAPADRPLAAQLRDYL